MRVRNTEGAFSVERFGSSVAIARVRPHDDLHWVGQCGDGRAYWSPKEGQGCRMGCFRLAAITARAIREARGNLEALYEFAAHQSRPYRHGSG